MGFLTAQCLTNFLNSKVKVLLRRKTRGSRKLSTAIITETIINELSVTVDLPVKLTFVGDRNVRGPEYPQKNKVVLKMYKNV